MLDNVRVGPKLVGGSWSCGRGRRSEWLAGQPAQPRIPVAEITDQRMAGLVVLGDLRAAQQSVWVGESRVAGGRSTDFSSRQADYAYIDQNLRRIDESWKAYEAIPHSTGETSQWEGLGSVWKSWRQGA